MFTASRGRKHFRQASTILTPMPGQLINSFLGTRGHCTMTSSKVKVNSAWWLRQTWWRTRAARCVSAVLSSACTVSLACSAQQRQWVYGKTPQHVPYHGTSPSPMCSCHPWNEPLILQALLWVLWKFKAKLKPVWKRTSFLVRETTLATSYIVLLTFKSVKIWLLDKEMLLYDSYENEEEEWNCGGKWWPYWSVSWTCEFSELWCQQFLWRRKHRMFCFVSVKI